MAIEKVRNVDATTEASDGAVRDSSVLVVADDLRHHGVSLAGYAAVMTGVAEGHDLDRVLAHAGLDPRTWPQAERAWSARLAEGVDDDEGDGLGASFDEHLADAQERYGRRLPPLEDDVAAWVAFRRHFSSSADPPALFAQLGLRGGEVARLCRVWSRRISGDPELAAQARRLVEEPLGEPPVPVPARIELPPAPALAVPRFASTRDAPHDSEPPSDVHGTTTAPMPPLRAAPSLLPFVPPHPSSVVAPLVEAGRLGLLPPQRAPRELTGTSAFTAFPVAPALPFGAKSEPLAQAAAPAEDTHTGTAPPFSVPPRAELPFSPMQASGEFVAKAVSRQPHPLAVTAAPFSAPLPAAPLPFLDSSEPRIKLGQAPKHLLSVTAPPFSVPGRAGLPFNSGPSNNGPAAKISHATPDPLAVTSLPFSISANPALPFHLKNVGDRAQSPTISEAPAVNKAPAALDATASFTVVPIAPALPFGPGQGTGLGRNSSRGGFATKPAESAQPGDAMPSGVATLGQYAALCAELAAFPALSDETFKKYGLGSREERNKADLAWKKRLEQNPNDYQTWQKLYRFYHAQCVTRGQSEMKP